MAKQFDRRIFVQRRLQSKLGKLIHIVLTVAVMVVGFEYRVEAGVVPGPVDTKSKSNTPEEASLESLVLHRVELATVGFDMLSQAPIVLLREPKSGEVVPIWVGVGEARAIAWALNGFDPPRPMTHDLTATLLKEMGAELVDVVVDDLRDATFHGKLKLRIKGEDSLRIVDTRPSDGLALALRTGATIHVADKILKETPKYDFLPPDESLQVVHILGVTVVKPSATHRRTYQLPDRSGVLVTHVSGVAQERGMRPGDLIVQVNERTPTSPMEFFDAIRVARPHRSVRITYVREGQQHRVKLPVEPVPQEPDSSPPPRGTLKV